MTTLLNILKQQTEHAVALLDLLNSENNALKQRDADALISIATQKTAQTQLLDQLTAKQNAALQDAGYSLNAEGLSAYIEHTDNGQRPALRQAAADLSDALTACQKQNRVNGNIIAANTRFVNTAIAILRNTVHGEQGTYDAQGRENNSDQVRPIAKA